MQEKALRFEGLRVLEELATPAGATSVISRLREQRNDEEGVRFAVFRLSEDPFVAVDAFIDTHGFAAASKDGCIWLLGRLFESPIVRKALGIFDDETPELFDAGWESEASYTLDGKIAFALVLGGAYSPSPACDPGEAKELGRLFVRSLFDDRYQDIVLVEMGNPWSTWFHDIFWDIGWVLLDRSEE